MKRYFRNCWMMLLTALLWGAVSGVSAAGISWQLALGKDFYTIPSLEKGFRLADFTEARVNRQGFARPWVLGVGVNLALPQGWHLAAELEGTYLTYDVLYSRNDPQPADPFYIKISRYHVKWARTAITANLKKDLFAIPMLTVYGGAGGGLHLVAPVVSDRFLAQTLLDKAAELDPSTDVSVKARMGGHLLAGVALHPPLFPVALALEGKYTLLPAGNFEEPNHFLTMMLKVLF